jgi:hypothetical protein
LGYGAAGRDGNDVAKGSGKDRNAQEHWCANEPKHPLTHNPLQTAVSPSDRFGNAYQEKQVLSMDRVLAAVAGFAEQKRRIDVQIAGLRQMLAGGSTDGAALRPPNSGVKCQPRQHRCDPVTENELSIKLTRGLPRQNSA